jgi:membrane-associated protease RseP (regulator of RpoE activity)
MYPDNIDTLTPIVARVLRIEDVTTGDAKRNYLVRYRGQLYGESDEAYDRLAESLRPMDITPLFRKDHDQHVVILMQGIVKPKPSNPVVNLVLIVLTLASMIFAGALSAYDGPAPANATSFWLGILQSLPKGLPFALSLLAILATHEFGHYLAGRFHKTHVTLPYFIPFPFSPFGTMGAFIQLKEPPKNKRILLDIGIAGPLAGLVVAIPILLYGLSLSEIQPIQLAPGQAFQLEGNSILYLLAKFLVFGKLLPQPASYQGMPVLLYWIRYFFTSQPLPIGGLDVFIHPIAWAGWAGLLVTALNLIPAGQLDGGHMMYVLLGQRVRTLWPYILVGLALLGLVWSGWWIWAALIFFLGRIYAEPLDQITPLDPQRRFIAILGIVIFFLVFTPVPLIIQTAGI